MRKTSLAPASMHAGPNMTPLVDVVMVILIFLMLAGSFGIHERAIRGEAYVHGNITCVPPPGPIVELPAQVDIHVHQSADGFDVVQMGGESIRSNDELTAKLKARHAQFAANGTADNVQIVIRPSAATEWGPVLAAYDAALRADFRKVGFAFAK